MLAIAISVAIISLILAEYNVLAFSSSSTDAVFPNSVPINEPNDILTLQRQTGQIAPSRAAIGKPQCCKCQHGFPQAFSLDPLPEGQNRINSGLVKLTCPMLVRAIDKMEDDGYIEKFTNLVENTSDTQLQQSVQDSHLTHATIRKQIIQQKSGGGGGDDDDETGAMMMMMEESPLKKKLGERGARAFLESGIAGTSRDKKDVKCLHAWLGDYLFREKDSLLGEQIALTLWEDYQVPLGGTEDCNKFCDFTQTNMYIEPPKARNKQRLKTRKERDRRKRLKAARTTTTAATTTKQEKE